MGKRRRVFFGRSDVERELGVNSRAEYPAWMRGLSHTQLVNPRGLRGIKLGPASRGRRLSRSERLVVEQQLRREGKL